MSKDNWQDIIVMFYFELEVTDSIHTRYDRTGAISF